MTFLKYTSRRNKTLERKNGDEQQSLVVAKQRTQSPKETVVNQEPLYY